MCLFILPFKANLVSQVLHMNGFYPSWTDAIYIFKWDFDAKLVSQVSQVNGFFSWWTDLICFFVWFFYEKHVLQMLHLKGFIPSWTDRICLFKSGFKAKRYMWRASFLDKKIIKVRIRTNNWDEETYRNKLEKVVSQTTDIIKTSNFGSLLMCFIGWKIVAIVKGGFFIQLSLADRFFPAYYAHCVLVHSSTVQLVSNSLKKDLIFLIFPVGV